MNINEPLVQGTTLGNGLTERDTELQSILTVLKQQNGTVVGHIYALRGIVDRVLGPNPEQDGVEAKAHVPEGAVPQIRQEQLLFAENIDRLGALISRLQNL